MLRWFLSLGLQVDLSQDLRTAKTVFQCITHNHEYNKMHLTQRILQTQHTAVEMQPMHASFHYKNEPLEETPTSLNQQITQQEECFIKAIKFTSENLKKELDNKLAMILLLNFFMEYIKYHNIKKESNAYNQLTFPIVVFSETIKLKLEKTKLPAKKHYSQLLTLVCICAQNSPKELINAISSIISKKLIHNNSIPKYLTEQIMEIPHEVAIESSEHVFAIQAQQHLEKLKEMWPNIFIIICNDISLISNKKSELEETLNNLQQLTLMLNDTMHLTMHFLTIYTITEMIMHDLAPYLSFCQKTQCTLLTMLMLIKRNPKNSLIIFILLLLSGDFAVRKIRGESEQPVISTILRILED